MLLQTPSFTGNALLWSECATARVSIVSQTRMFWCILEISKWADYVGCNLDGWHHVFGRLEVRDHVDA